MRAHPNLLVAVSRTNRELDAATINADHARFALDASTSWRRCQMTYIDARAERAFVATGRYLVSKSIESCAQPDPGAAFDELPGR